MSRNRVLIGVAAVSLVFTAFFAACSTNNNGYQMYGSGSATGSASGGSGASTGAGSTGAMSGAATGNVSSGASAGSGAATGSNASGHSGASGSTASGSSATCGVNSYRTDAGACKCAGNAYSVDGGPCTCEFGFNTSCPDSTGALQCVTTATDPDNCGACGTKCPTASACVAGKCGPEPTTLVPPAAGCLSIRLVRDATKLYWSDEGHGTISSIATTGGTATPVVTGQSSPTSLVVHNGSLYWISKPAGDAAVGYMADSLGTAIMSLPMGSTTPTTLIASGSAPAVSSGPPPESSAGGVGIGLMPGPAPIEALGLSSDGTTLYFAAGTRIYKMPSAGGAVKMVGYSQGPEHGVPTALAVADPNYIVYPADISGNVEIMSLMTTCTGAFCTACAPFDAGAAMGMEDPCPVRPGRSQSGLIKDSIYVRGDSVYWGNLSSINVASITGAIAGTLGTSSAFPNTTFSGPITGFAIGTSYGYFGEDSCSQLCDPTTAGCQCKTRSACLAGTCATIPESLGGTNAGFVEKAFAPPYDADTPPALIIARNQPVPMSMVVDGTHVFWTTSRCDIMSLTDTPQ